MNEPIKSIRETIDHAVGWGRPEIALSHWEKLEREWAARDATLLAAAADRYEEWQCGQHGTASARDAILDRPRLVAGQLVRLRDQYDSGWIYEPYGRSGATRVDSALQPVLTTDGKWLIVREDGRVEVSDD